MHVILFRKVAGLNQNDRPDFQEYAEGISEFDGQHYRLVESPATGAGWSITDMCPDQLNPETYRISFSASGRGGYARYQGNFWEKLHVNSPVLSLAQADRIIFLATPNGVDYLIE